MSFRRALLGFSLCCAAPNVALAQQTRQVEVSYDITFLGFTGFRIDFSGTFAGTRYDVQSHTFKEGVMRAMTIHYDGRNRAWGGFSPQGTMPNGGSLSIVVGDKPRTWLAQYGAGGLVQEQHSPDWQPRPDQTIPEDKRLGSLDPLSAAISVGSRKGDVGCRSTISIPTPGVR